MLVFVLLEDFFPPPPLIPEKSGAAQLSTFTEIVFLDSISTHGLHAKGADSHLPFLKAPRRQIVFI
jgi:hypothetical protein